MQIQLKAKTIWLAEHSVDFRKGANGLCEYVASHYKKSFDDTIYVFYNNAKDKLKLLAYHRNGFVLIYKRLEKKKFTVVKNSDGLYELSEKHLSWLLAGLDWLDMSSPTALFYDDFY